MDDTTKKGFECNELSLLIKHEDKIQKLEEEIIGLKNKMKELIELLNQKNTSDKLEQNDNQTNNSISIKKTKNEIININDCKWKKMMDDNKIPNTSEGIIKVMNHLSGYNSGKNYPDESFFPLLKYFMETYKDNYINSGLVDGLFFATKRIPKHLMYVCKYIKKNNMLNQIQKPENLKIYDMYI